MASDLGVIVFMKRVDSLQLTVIAAECQHSCCKRLQEQWSLRVETAVPLLCLQGYGNLWLLEPVLVLNKEALRSTAFSTPSLM